MVADFAAYFDEAHAITCKAVRQIPEDRKDFRAVPEMMTAFDLIFHMFSQEKVMLTGCCTGKIELKEFDRIEEDKKQLRTIEDLARYGEQIHRETSMWMARASAEDLVKPVDTFFGSSTPDKLAFSALVHIFHHRGQLYVYLRLMGIEPVFVWTGEPVPVARDRLSQIRANEAGYPLKGGRG